MKNQLLMSCLFVANSVQFGALETGIRQGNLRESKEIRLKLTTGSQVLS